MPGISAVVLTKNEEKNIKDCLESLKWCDEIILIDDFSEDKTVNIAKKSGAKVYQRKLNNDFASQRNFGLDKAKNEWVFFLDADERISKELGKEISLTIDKWSTLSGFYFHRRDIVWRKSLRHGETNIRLLRLGKKNRGRWKRAVHEYWDIKPKGFDDRLGEFHEHDGFIEHYPHPTLREFISDIERYSTIHAEENYREGKRSNLLKVIFYPKLKFLQNYFLRLGFLDGHQGFMVAMLMSLHSYLAWSKLWVLQKKNAYEDI